MCYQRKGIFSVTICLFLKQSCHYPLKDTSHVHYCYSELVMYNAFINCLFQSQTTIWTVASRTCWTHNMCLKQHDGESTMTQSQWMSDHNLVKHNFSHHVKMQRSPGRRPQLETSRSCLQEICTSNWAHNSISHNYTWGVIDSSISGAVLFWQASRSRD